MPTDETPEKRESEVEEKSGSEKKTARNDTFHLLGADKSGSEVIVGRGSNTTERDLEKGAKACDAPSSGRPSKVVSIDVLQQMAQGSDPNARFAQDLLSNVQLWQKMEPGQEKDAYARKQQIAAMGMLGFSIQELEPQEAESKANPETRDETVSQTESQTHGVAKSPTESEAHAPTPAPKAPQSVNPNIVETKAVFLETADLRALREEDLALGKKGGPAEHFLALLDNFRKILKPGKEQDAAVRRVKRMALSLLSGRLQELQTKKGTTDDGRAAPGEAIVSKTPVVSDQQFILDLKEKMRGETAQHKVPAQFYERRQSLQEWAKELDGHLSKLRELNKSTDVTERQNQPVGLNAALSQGASKSKAISHTETEIRKALAMMSEKDIKDMLATEEHKQIISDLLYGAIVTAATRQAAGIFLTPGWQKSHESVRQLASLAIKDNSFELLKSTCRYCTPDVRHGFRQTPEAAEAQKVFSMYGKHLNEVLQYGRESLTTQLGTAEGFAYGWFGAANKDEIKKFVDKASSEDRHRYLLGERLAALSNPSNNSNLDAEEKQAVSFYKEVDAALRAATNPVINSKQYDLLRNKLVGGEEIYAALRELHKDEMFGLLKSNDMKGMRRAVELLSLKDWTNLRENSVRLVDLDQRLKKFLNPQEHSEIMGMLRAKVGDKTKDNLTYEESQKRGRVPIEIALLGTDPERWNVTWTAQNSNQLEKLQLILQMSPLEVGSYLKDKGTPRYLDALVEAQLTGEYKLVAERTLKFALNAGKLETDEISNAIIARLSGAPLSEQLQKFELILSRPGVMVRLKSPQDAETKSLRASLDLMVKEFVESMKRLDLHIGKTNALSPADYSRRIFETSAIPIDLRLLLSEGCSLSLTDLLKLSADERKVLTADEGAGGNAFLQMKVFSTIEQRDFACRILESGKKVATDIDKMRAAVVGLSEDRGRVILRLSSMSPGDLAKTVRTYDEQYNSSLVVDLFVAAVGRERTQVQEIFAQESKHLLPKGALAACRALSVMCKEQRTALAERSDEDQEFIEELAFNYALCREINNRFVKSGLFNLTTAVPLKEAINVLALSLAAQSWSESNSAVQGKSPRSAAPAKSVNLTLLKAIMAGDFDHSLFADTGERRQGSVDLHNLSESIACNLKCLRIQEYALSVFDERRSNRFLQMMDVLQKRIANIPARISFWQEFEKLLIGGRASTPAASSVSQSDRHWLAEQVLCECAFPNNVKAGIGNETNTVTIACNLLCDNKPATFVRLIARSAVEDQFETTDGTVLKPSEYGAFCDDLDIIELRGRSNDSCAADYSDLVGTTDRPVRNLAGKIAQTVLSNIYWKRNAISIPVVGDNDILRLARADEDHVQARMFNVGEVTFVSTEFGHELHVVSDGHKKVLHEYMNERTPVLVPSRSPRIDPDFLPDIYNQVAQNQRTEPQLLNAVDNSEATRAF